MSRLRIAVSQRRDAVEGRSEVRDGIDVHLAALLWDLGFLPLPIPSGIANPAAYMEVLLPNGILLSGGNDIGSMPERDALETAALTYAADNYLPVLGICRGMQMINNFQGGTLRPVECHAAVRHLVSGTLFAGNFREVNSYHNLGILAADIGAELDAVTWADDGVVEALQHRQLPWLGVMWHPEREVPATVADRELIYNHFLT